MTFSEFIQAHDGDNLGKLALSRGRFASQVVDFDLALTTLEVRRKLRDKVPQWYAVPSLRFPLRVSGEQCSSTATATYKARIAMAEGVPPETVASRPLPCVASSRPPLGPSLLQGRGWPWVSGGTPSAMADLTGGLGVDCWAFAQVFEKVLYNEMLPELSDAAAHNFRELGLTNITVRNCEIKRGNVAEVLGDFRPDVIFLDPARRAADGRKVFRLEDCQPDVLQLLPELLAACPRVLLKLSPMVDITLVCKQLGCVKEVHVVAADGECKELLLLLEAGWTEPHSLTIVEDGTVMGLGTEVPEPMATLCPQSFKILFEPGKALLKAGAFDLPCQFGLSKLGQHTHLYVGEEVPLALQPFGKSFRVLESAPLDKRSIKSVGQKYPRADVTARNIPLTSEQLRKKLGVADGGSVHIFGVHIDSLGGNYLLVTIPF